MCIPFHVIYRAFQEIETWFTLCCFCCSLVPVLFTGFMMTSSIETCPRYWPFVQGIHRSPVNSLHKGQSHRALMSSLIYAWINDCINNREAGDLRRHCAHYDVTVMVPAKHPRTLWVNESFKKRGKYHHRKTKQSKTVWMFYRLYNTKCSVLLSRCRNRYHSYYCLIIWTITFERKILQQLVASLVWNQIQFYTQSLSAISRSVFVTIVQGCNSFLRWVCCI